MPDELKTLEHPGQWNGMLRVYRDQSAAWAGEPRAVPLAGGGAVLVLNTQRLADPALKEKYLAKFGLLPRATPATWRYSPRSAKPART